VTQAQGGAEYHLNGQFVLRGSRCLPYVFLLPSSQEMGFISYFPLSLFDMLLLIGRDLGT
jgi:hypothetical protein